MRENQGFFDSEFGLGYVNAYESGYIDDLSHGARIGGKYVDSNGHPRDSEREWFAETTSAVIIGEKIPERARPALIAPQRLFKRLKASR